MVGTGLPWAIDNGAFAGFDPVAFRNLLSRAVGQPGLIWVAAPDVVGDSVETRRRFDDWQPELTGQGFPLAFVLQDGVESGGVPWETIRAVFIGGSTEFKLSPEAEALTREAKARGKLAHMGRVNSLKRLRHAMAIGCDTVDGTAASMFGDKYLPAFARWIRMVRVERTLF